MDHFRVGLIAKPHGVKGAVKLIPLSEDISRYNTLKEAFLERNGEYIPIEVTVISAQADAVYAFLSCSHDRNDAEMLRNLYISVDREHAAKLPEGRYYITDLIGCAVYDTADNCFGRIDDVLETGANDVYVVRGERTLMMPALRKLIKDVDIAQKRMLVDAAVLEEVGLFED